MASHVQVSVSEHSISGGASPDSDCGRFLPLKVYTALKGLHSPKRAPCPAIFEFRWYSVCMLTRHFMAQYPAGSIYIVLLFPQTLMSVQMGRICVPRMPTVLTMRVTTLAHVLMALLERDFTTVEVVSCIHPVADLEVVRWVRTNHPSRC